MARISSDRADPKGKLFDNVVYKLDRAIPVMFRKDRQCSNMSSNIAFF
jgi:hypothetical protein